MLIILNNAFKEQPYSIGTNSISIFQIKKIEAWAKELAQSHTTNK